MENDVKAYFEPLATALHAYYESLLKAGFTKEEAMVLTFAYQELLHR